MSVSIDSRLSEIAAQAVAAVAPGRQISPDSLAISLVDLTAPQPPGYGGFHDDQPFYPASIVKLFFLVAACIALEKHSIEPAPELLTALKEMIVNSSNAATGYVVDLLTGTQSGEELPEKEMARWSAQRQSINKLFLQRGYGGINICQKTWDDAPYGRDKVFLGGDLGNRNRLTAGSTSKLIEAIVLGKIADPEHTAFMMKLLERDYTKPSDDPDDQATGFCASALPEGARLWSKAGWTSEVRHDAAYIEFADGKRLIMVIFTRGCSDNHELIPRLASQVLSKYRQ